MSQPGSKQTTAQANSSSKPERSMSDADAKLKAMEHEVSAKAIARVAPLIPGFNECKLLAAELGYSKAELLHVKSFDETTASTILNKWVAKNGKNATSRKLYEALVAIELAEIADEVTAYLVKPTFEDVDAK